MSDTGQVAQADLALDDALDEGGGSALPHQREEAARELAMRRKVFPPRVTAGKMSRSAADYRLDVQARLVETLDILIADEALNQQFIASRRARRQAAAAAKAAEADALEGLE